MATICWKDRTQRPIDLRSLALIAMLSAPTLAAAETVKSIEARIVRDSVFTQHGYDSSIQFDGNLMQIAAGAPLSVGCSMAVVASLNLSDIDSASYKNGTGGIWLYFTRDALKRRRLTNAEEYDASCQLSTIGYQIGDSSIKETAALGSPEDDGTLYATSRESIFYPILGFQEQETLANEINALLQIGKNGDSASDTRLKETVRCGDIGWWTLKDGPVTNEFPFGRSYLELSSKYHIAFSYNYANWNLVVQNNSPGRMSFISEGVTAGGFVAKSETRSFPLNTIDWVHGFKVKIAACWVVDAGSSTDGGADRK